MKTIIELPDSTEQLFDGYKTIYQAMSVKQDFTNHTNAEFYKSEELALEVV